MRRSVVGVAFVALMAAGAGGCASDGGVPGRHRAVVISPRLVMPGPGLHAATARPGDPHAWEYGRNDERLNAAETPPARRHEVAVIHTRDHLRTSNGRPREFSTTLTRTITYKAVP